MKFSKEKPPIWDRLQKAFNVEWGTVAVTYGDTVHTKNELDPSIVIHEAVHSARQKNPADWWERYLRDSKFRFGEELLAYRKQYEYLAATTPNRDVLARHLFNLSRDLVRLYDLPITQQEAIKLIKMR